MQNSFSFIIFGATGDLTKRKLIPSLYELYRHALLPENFKIFAFARRPFTNESFIETLAPFITDPAAWPDFASHVQYVQGDFSNSEAFTSLKDQIVAYDGDVQECTTRVFYMATSPDELSHIVERMHEVGLHKGCDEQGTNTRIVIEKPFGRDVATARELNATLNKYFMEEQIYRIDHYLGKETVQNILSVRFANIFFGPVWNREFIEKIEISAFETLGVEDRGGYYDTSGALRDMVQSHLLQIMALVMMDQPARFDAHEIRDKKNEVLKALRPMNAERISSDTVRGQYQGYTSESKVSPNSETETFVALRAHVDLPHWQDVPVILRTGKQLNERKAEIKITFKRSKGTVFSNLFCELRSNELVIRLQPDEGVKMKMLIKEPGFEMRLADVFLDYSYSDTFKNLPDAYERLLLDVMHGDQSLFTRTDEIESSWEYVTRILDLWKQESVSLQTYATGSKGVELVKKLP